MNEYSFRYRQAGARQLLLWYQCKREIATHHKYASGIFPSSNYRNEIEGLCVLTTRIGVKIAIYWFIEGCLVLRLAVPWLPRAIVGLTSILSSISPSSVSEAVYWWSHDLKDSLHTVRRDDFKYQPHMKNTAKGFLDEWSILDFHEYRLLNYSSNTHFPTTKHPLISLPHESLYFAGFLGPFKSPIKKDIACREIDDGEPRGLEPKAVIMVLEHFPSICLGLLIRI